MRIKNAESIAGIVDALEITPELHGNILLIGCAGMFESVLISNDIFADPIPLSPNITRLVGIDDQYLFDEPEDFFPRHKIQFFAFTSTYTYQQKLWDHTPFQFIFMLRIPNLDDLIAQNGLLDDIHPLLSDEGFFVVSGNSAALPFIRQDTRFQIQ